MKDGQVRRMIVEGFEIVKEGVTMREEAKITQYAKANGRMISRSVVRVPLNLFLRMIPKVVWEHLCDHSNREMDRRVREGEVSKDYASRYCDTVTVSELLLIFGVRMRLELNDSHAQLTKRMRMVLASLH